MPIYHQRTTSLPAMPTRSGHPDYKQEDVCGVDYTSQYTTVPIVPPSYNTDTVEQVAGGVARITIRNDSASQGPSRVPQTPSFRRGDSQTDDVFTTNSKPPISGEEIKFVSTYTAGAESSDQCTQTGNPNASDVIYPMSPATRRQMTSATTPSQPGTPVHFRIASGSSGHSSVTSTSSFALDPDTDLTSDPTLTSNTIRSDRPSSSASTSSDHSRVASRRMMVKSQSSHEFRALPERSRVLSRNESMRMDRPSEFS